MLQFDTTGYGNLAATDLSHRYLWNPQAVDQLFADEQVDWSDEEADGEVLSALADHLGSVGDVVDSNGELRVHRRFDGFGNIVDETHYNAGGSAVTAGQTGYVDEAFAFTGRWFDKATGLQNNLNRWYDPHVGRWLSEDPIGFKASDGNLYRYVGNGPTNFVDPSGLADLPIIPPEARRIWQNYIDEGQPLPAGFAAQYAEYIKAFANAQRQLALRNAASLATETNGKMIETYTNSLNRSARRLDRINQLSRRTCPPLIDPAIGGAGVVAVVDDVIPAVSELTGDRLGHFLDNTLGQNPSDFLHHMWRLLTPGAGRHWTHIFELEYPGGKYQEEIPSR